MTDKLFSPSWYRVANLKPRIRSHVTIHRHEYRGRIWFVVEDPASGRTHRLSPAAYRFVGLMDGERTVDTLWHVLNAQAGDEAPTQDEVIRLLGQLHAADAMICDVPPDSREVFRRYQKHQRTRLKQRIWTPLAVRIPLLDPERFLSKTYPYLRWIFSPAGLVVWIVVVATGAALAGANWGELTENVADRALAPANLLVLWLVYPFVKALHELGHGYAITKYGGEVHEVGIMFLVLVPVPYVDATASSGFRDKRQRMLVGAAGIMVELFLGALAMFVWLSVETGFVHAIAYNVMLISGVSTLLFNGNPLLRFDGYYVLTDWLEIPNLGTRSNKYIGYLVQKYLFKSKDAESPARLTGERVWFVIYGIGAFCYRVFIIFAIILYIGTRFFALGVLLAAWSFATMVIVPFGKQMKFLFASPTLKQNRIRSIGVSALMAALIGGLLFVLPVPYWTRAEGVTWPIENSQVRADGAGFVVQLLVPEGSRVRRGQPIIETADAILAARVRLLEASRRELESRLMAARATDRVRAEVFREALAAADASLRHAKRKLTELVIRSPRDGVLVVPRAGDLPDRFVRQGELLGYVMQPSDPVSLRVAVSQEEIGRIRENIRGVEVLPVAWGADSYPAEIRRQVPGGAMRLPAVALGVAGGGRIAVDPRDPDGLRTLERVFELDIDLPPTVRAEFLGQRVYVRLDHGYKAPGIQMYIALRQLFLRQFGV
jgi:putative peptide zinc metalloprotease protein